MQILAADFREAGAQGGEPLKLCDLPQSSGPHSLANAREHEEVESVSLGKKPQSSFSPLPSLFPSLPNDAMARYSCPRDIAPTQTGLSNRVCDITYEESRRECRLRLVSSEAWSCHQGPRFFPTLCSAVSNGSFMLLLGARWQQQVQGHTHMYHFRRKMGDTAALASGKPSYRSSHFCCLISQKWVIDSFLSNPHGRGWENTWPVGPHLTSQPPAGPGLWLHGGERNFGGEQMLVDNPAASTIKPCHISY